MPSSKTKTINLALQGGGAHGAFTWGVLDALLEDGRVAFDGVTATSAGAMNAVALAHGLALGDNDHARQTLETFWFEVSKAGMWSSPIKRNPIEIAMALNPIVPDWSLDESMAFYVFQALTKAASPYQFNPLNINPLRDVVKKVIDFEAVNACHRLNLFINATAVETGMPRVFYPGEISVDVVMASAALPFLFQAVEINGQSYWDGGYMGNPSLWPLFYKAKSRDVLIVHVNPIQRAGVPTQPYTIENRLNEITFNTSLVKEIRAIGFVKKLLREDMLKDEYKDQYRDILLHAIRTDEVMCDLSIASKFDTEWAFLLHLKGLGRAEGHKWLAAHYGDINKQDTIDLEKEYLRV